MPITVVDQNAVHTFLDYIRQNEAGLDTSGALYFTGARAFTHPRQQELLSVITPLMEEQDGTLYVLGAGNFIILWQGLQKAMLEALTSRLYGRFAPKQQGKLHQYYDLKTDAGDLRQLLETMLSQMEAKSATVKNAFKPLFTSEQQQAIRHYSSERRTLAVPTVLIVEDQEFSRKLLEGMLGRNYIYHSAKNAEEAVALYAEHIPCIALLDVELPDFNGHDLAAFFKKYDPESYIVMVTANHSEADVERARMSQVQGFIVKPYSKQKITEAIEKFLRNRKMRA